MATVDLQTIILDSEGKAEFAHISDLVEHGVACAPDNEFCRREKKLVRKLDMTLMPMVWILYLFNYLDRNNMA